MATARVRIEVLARLAPVLFVERLDEPGAQVLRVEVLGSLTRQTDVTAHG